MTDCRYLIVHTPTNHVIARSHSPFKSTSVDSIIECMNKFNELDNIDIIYTHDNIEMRELS